MLSLLEAGGLLGLAAAAGYWLEAMRSKELAREAGKRACRAADVQFLDDTVQLTRVRLRRDARGRLAFRREYRFEFTPDGVTRERGAVTLHGRRVLRLVLTEAGESAGKC